jgi:hypothetical protein
MRLRKLQAAAVQPETGAGKGSRAGEMRVRSNMSSALIVFVSYAAAFLLAPAGRAQDSYQFTNTNGGPSFLYQMDPSGIVGDCFTSVPGYCAKLYTAGASPNVTFSMTAPATVTATSANGAIQLGAATFNFTVSGASGLTFQVSNGDRSGKPDPGVTSCSGAGAGFACATNGLISAPGPDNNGTYQVGLNMRIQVTNQFNPPATATIGVQFNWHLAPQAMPVITGIRVVQVTQTPGNEVSLTPGKNTVVQVFLKDNLPAGAVVELKSLDHDNLSALDIDGSAVQASQQGNAFNFHLPPEWYPDKILNFLAQVKLGNTILVKGSAAAIIEDPPLWPKPYTVLYLTLCDGNLCAGQGISPVPLGDADQLTAQLFPIPNGGLSYIGLPGTWKAFSLITDAATLLAQLRFLDLSLLELLGPAAPDQLVAWYPAGSTFGSNNPVGFYDNYLLYVYGLGRIAVLSDRGSARATQVRLASGLAHNLVQLHQDLRDPSGVGLGGYDTALNAEVGASRPDLLKGVAVVDAENAWLSPGACEKIYTAYKDASDFLGGRGGGGGRASAKVRRNAGSAEYLTITGSARRDGSGGQLNPGFRSFPPYAGPNSDPNGNHCDSAETAGR